MKQQKTRKRIEAAFIEPMQCKPVTVLPAGEKWSFEIKFDGYRCIAVKRRPGGHAILTPQEGAQQTLPWGCGCRSRHSIATSFSMENWLHWIRKGDLPFRFFKTTLSRTLPVYFYAFDLLNRDGELAACTYRSNAGATC